MAAGGRWSFAFFDREPHALFGEEVKTRNAIVFRLAPDSGRHSSPLEIQTGPLQKWTSRNRATLFSSIDFTPLESADIAAGIPKISGKLQSHVVSILRGQVDSLSGLWLDARACRPMDAYKKPEVPTVFVASTAYNFLNVFRSHEIDRQGKVPFTENPILALQFESEERARAALAILSSRLVFWWWHTHGDGFHVSRAFIGDIPIGLRALTGRRLRMLADCGLRFWRALQNHVVVSVNGGRQSVAYRPLACEVERNQVDSILLEALGIPAEFEAELVKFVRKVVIVDESDTRRNSVRSHFHVKEER
jgi:hypothetical protein